MTQLPPCVCQIMKDRSRNIGLLLYPEWENINDILEKIKTCSHAYILHDKDLKETEEIEEEKKNHIHCYLQFENARSFRSISKWLGIEDRFIQGISNRNSYLRYLVHLDNPEKYQYKLTDLRSAGLDSEIEKAFSLSVNLSSGHEFKLMYEFIVSSHKILSYRDLSSFAIENDVITYLRQYYSILKDLLIEHNERINLKNDKTNY